MNTLNNKVQLIGNLGIDPQMKAFDGGKKLAKFSVATHRSFKNDKGEKVKNTQWHNLIAWGRTAEYIEKMLKKGMEVAVQGTLLSRSYVDKNGVKRFIKEIQVSEVILVK